MKYFGTDGIRGKSEMFTDELLNRVAISLCKVSQKRTFVIVRDSRKSGKDIEQRLVKHLVNAGAKVHLAGIAPTPVCAMLARDLGIEWGIVISASHNPPDYNGIKIFNGNGEKISGKCEAEIDALIESKEPYFAFPCGAMQYVADAYERYIKAVQKANIDLMGMRILLDCAYGATAELAPMTLRALGADVEVINGEFDGDKINVDSGATCIEALQNAMEQGDYDLGFAFDGDGDRVIAVKNGKVYNGDEIMYLIAVASKEVGQSVSGVAITQTCNYGVEEALCRSGIIAYRSEVGDKNLAVLMKNKCLPFGSEESGHVIIKNHLPTGDGIFTSAVFAQVVKHNDIESMNDITTYPQCSGEVICERNIGFMALERLEKSGICKVLSESKIRSVVRMSGTENKIRILCEGGDLLAVKVAVDCIACMIKQSVLL